MTVGDHNTLAIRYYRTCNSLGRPCAPGLFREYYRLQPLASGIRRLPLRERDFATM